MKFYVERIRDGGTAKGAHIFPNEDTSFLCPQQTAAVKITVTFDNGSRESCLCSLEEASVFAQAIVEILSDA